MSGQAYAASTAAFRAVMLQQQSQQGNKLQCVAGGQAYQMLAQQQRPYLDCKSEGGSFEMRLDDFANLLHQQPVQHSQRCLSKMRPYTCMLETHRQLSYHRSATSAGSKSSKLCTTLSGLTST